MSQCITVQSYDDLDQLNFIYPHYESPFPVRINLNYSRWMERYCYEWAINNCDPIKDHHQYGDLIRASDLGLYSACTYPSANWHRLEKLIKWCIMFFIVDDFHDSYNQINNNNLTKENDDFWQFMLQMLDSFQQNNKNQSNYGQRTEWPELIKAIETLLREIYFDFTPEQIERSTNMIKEYVSGNLMEKKWLVKNNNSPPLPDWNSYIEARLGSVGGQMTLQLVEYARNIELTENEWNHPLMKNLIKAVSEEMILVNDFYTFRKEVAENDFKFSQMKHAFSILVNQSGITLQQAVNEVHKMIQNKDKVIIKLIDQIKTDPILNSNPEDGGRLRNYLDGVKEVLGGYWRFAITSRRYHGINFGGHLPFGGRFVYNIAETLILGPVDQYEWYHPIPDNVQPK